MLRWFVYFTLCFLCTAGVRPVFGAVGWRIVNVEGRDHVPIDNVASFYGFTRTVSGKSFALKAPNGSSLVGAAGSKELYINGVKFILSYPVEEKDGDLLLSRMDLGKLVEPVLRPGRITGGKPFDTVVLDAGHGGHDQGARSRYGAEKNFTLDVVFRTKKLLEAQGITVRLSRSSDRFIPLESRVAYANRFPGAVFVSVHFNSGQSLANGIETFTLAPQGVPSSAADGASRSDFRACAGNVRDPENMALATATHAALLSRLQVEDRGIKRARFVVIRDIKVPGVLIEGGFLSNATDSRRIATAAYRQQMAQSIVDALRRYRSALMGEKVRQLELARSIGSGGASDGEGPTVIVPSGN